MLFGIPNDPATKVNTVTSTVDEFHRGIAKRIKALAARKKISQNVLADLAVVGRGQMSAILNAKQSPTARTLKKIADALEVDVRELLPSTK